MSNNKQQRLNQAIENAAQAAYDLWYREYTFPVNIEEAFKAGYREAVTARIQARAAYLSGHHDTTCVCVACEYARAMLRVGGRQ